MAGGKRAALLKSQKFNENIDKRGNVPTTAIVRDAPLLVLLAVPFATIVRCTSPPVPG